MHGTNSELYLNISKMFIKELIQKPQNLTGKLSQLFFPSHLTAATKATLPKPLLHQEYLFAGQGSLAWC